MAGKAVPVEIGNVEPEAHSGSYFIIEALIGSNPLRPTWHRVVKTAVTGWERFENGKARMEHYALHQFWNDVLAWDDRETAERAYRWLSKQKQQYPLRLVEHFELKTGRVIGVPMDIAARVREVQREREAHARRDAKWQAQLATRDAKSRVGFEKTRLRGAGPKAKVANVVVGKRP